MPGSVHPELLITSQYRAYMHWENNVSLASHLKHNTYIVKPYDMKIIIQNVNNFPWDAKSHLSKQQFFARFSNRKTLRYSLLFPQSWIRTHVHRPWSHNALSPPKFTLSRKYKTRSLSPGRSGARARARGERAARTYLCTAARNSEKVCIWKHNGHRTDNWRAARVLSRGPGEPFSYIAWARSESPPASQRRRRGPAEGRPRGRAIHPMWREWTYGWE